MSLGINTKPSEEPVVPRRGGYESSIEKPIFITGLGRSGTTLIHTMLSTHPQVNWLSLLCGKFPKRPYLNRWLMSAIDVPIVNIYLRRRFVPLENYAFWDFYFPGFSMPNRDLVASDVSLRTKRALRTVASELLTAKRRRLLVKITGMPRMSFLRNVFPDAKFIHVIRDGRAVADSRMNTFWKGWQGLNIWPGKMPAEYQEEWERHHHSFVALAGIEWKTHLDYVEVLKKDFPDISICQVRYEAFCADPIAELRRIANHCELSWPKDYDRAIRKQYVHSENEKWKKDLTDAQRKILEDVLRPYLIKYGYEGRGQQAPTGSSRTPVRV